MANPFAIEPANPLQALMMGVQGFDTAAKRTKEQQLMEGRQRIAGRLGAGANPRDVFGELMGLGDIQGAGLVNQIAHAQATEALAREEAKRRAGEFAQTHGLQRQQFEFQRAQAEEAAKGYQTREIEDPNNPGSKILVREKKSTGEVNYLPVQGLPNVQGSPYAPTQKLTADESKDRLFLGRALESHKTISGLEGINEGFQGMVGGVAAGRPMIRDSFAFNKLASADRQKVIQAQRDFVNAILRKESGAVINPDEFANASKQYFPQPGDGPEVIAQKRVNRMNALEGLMAGAGRGYKPPEDYIGTKGPAYPKDQGRVELGKRLKFNPATGEIE